MLVKVLVCFLEDISRWGLPQLPSPGDSEANTINPLKDESDQKTPDSGDEKQEDANPAERNPQQEVQNTPPLDNLRHAVDQAASSGPDNMLPQPNLAVGSTPMDIDLGHGETPGNPSQDPVINSDSKQYLDVAKIDANTGLPSSLVPPNSGLPADNTAADANPTAPPPVPPPMVPPRMPTSGQQPLPNAENDNQEQQPLAPL